MEMDAHMMKRSLFIVILLGSFNLFSSIYAMQWSSPAYIPGSAGAIHAAVAMDASGNALVAWQVSTANNPVIRIAYYTATGQSWSSVKELGSAYNKSNVYVSMSASGTGIIAWIDGQQVVQTVAYAQQDWVTWQPVLVRHSLLGDQATAFYIPQNFSSTTYLAWTSSSGVYGASYRALGDVWSEPKLLMNGPCYSTTCAVDTLGNGVFEWIAQSGTSTFKVCAALYDATQSFDTWVPVIQILSQTAYACSLSVGICSLNNQVGTAIFAWIDTKGLQATLYNSATAWQSWSPAAAQKLLGSSVLFSAQATMDTLGNILFAMQLLNNYCQQTFYSATQLWNDWKPENSIIVKDKTIVNDIVLTPSQIGLIMLTSLERYRLNTVYVASTDPATTPVAINRTCIPSSQKMLALQQGSDPVAAMALWPSMPADGICYIVA